jgi:hypothetical protein
MKGCERVCGVAKALKSVFVTKFYDLSELSFILHFNDFPEGDEEVLSVQNCNPSKVSNLA